MRYYNTSKGNLAGALAVKPTKRGFSERELFLHFRRKYEYELAISSQLVSD